VVALPKPERSKTLTNLKTVGIRCVKVLCIGNKAGVWGQSHQPPEINEGSGADAATILQLFSKKCAFLGIVCSKFCVYRWLNKVLMRPQSIRPGERSPT